MNDIDRLYGDHLVTSRCRPILISGLRKGQLKAMNPDIEPTTNERARTTGIGRGGTRHPNEESETRFGTTLQQPLNQELDNRVEERSREGASIAVFSPEPRSRGKALRVIRRVLEGGRSVLRGLRSAEFAPSSIVRELSVFLEQFSTGAVRCEVSVAGHPRELKPVIQEQINLIVREALINALLHSEATCIEADVEYLPHRLRIVVRDNGRGIDPQIVRAQTDAHWGIVGMRDRAKSIGAKLTIWSRPGAGTEVEISVSTHAFEDACA
jgi:signal transduction histidine kinase